MPAASLHLLIPFALPPAEARKMLGAPGLPALERVVARAAVAEQQSGDAFQRTLPHERWLAQRFGVGEAGTDAAPLAPYMLIADGGTPGDVPWACVEPVHVRIARDHLVLLDPASIAIQSSEAAALLDIVQPLIEELDVRLQAPQATRWYLSSAALATLDGASPLRASGRNIEIWLPHETRSGERSRLWMKLQNEVQMAWFEHPINEAREARGEPTVNSVWFHSQGVFQPPTRAFGQVLSHTCAARGLALAAGAHAGTPPDAYAAVRLDDATLVELDTLSTPFVTQDWHGWQSALADLERNWFAPALAALTARQLERLELTLCGDTGWTTLVLRRTDLMKFWRRRTFASLFETETA